MHTSFQSSRREHRRRVRSMPARLSLASPISALRGALWRASRGAGRVDGPTLGTRDVVGWPAVADRAPSPASPGGKSPSACLWSLALGPNPYSRMCSACGTRCGVARRHRDRVAATDATATQHAPTIRPRLCVQFEYMAANSDTVCTRCPCIGASRGRITARWQGAVWGVGGRLDWCLSAGRRWCTPGSRRPGLAQRTLCGAGQ